MKRRIEHIIDEHGSRLRHLALMLLGQSDEVDDVVQDALIKLWHHQRTVETGNELPWLLTCTRNACLDRLRTRTRKRGLMLRLVGEQHIHRQDHSADSPAEITDQQRRQHLLISTLSELPEPSRSLLILRDLQDLDIATTARCLELSENQVKVYTFRARRRLRKKIEEVLHEQVA